MILDFITRICFRSIYRIILYAVLVISGSLVFDLIHVLAHRSQRSRFPVLRFLAQAHSFHHKYFGRDLKFNDGFRVQNLVWHVPLELLCHLAGSALSWLLVKLISSDTVTLSELDLAFVWALQIGQACLIVCRWGHDSNHVPYKQLPMDPYFFFVGPQYHAMHHIAPDSNFGSMIRLVDWIFGTVGTLRGRRVAMTGSRGALGQALTQQLSLAQVKRIKPLRFGIEWRLDEFSELDPVLAETDILILAHGTKENSYALQSNCTSVRTIIDRFQACYTSSGVRPLPEVWYIGSEAELHGSWSKTDEAYTKSKRAFVPFARSYYNKKKFLYRHIVPSAFASPMGSGLVSADWCSRVVLWWISRGARYVPVTYTGLAYVNYFSFVFGCSTFLMLIPMQPIEPTQNSQRP
ncbi:sterol desaturase/short chain dehydrogenase [Bipolaris maydis]|nr:sterol desaturase/short chain dehydrogenase [Bipolaris maydis]KAJ5052489.1 sterol desaturase/short chain dehydrogenase [Bipolaris maydis]